MEQEYNKYLPLGTLVKIDERLKKVMIIGFCMKLEKDPNRVYDYIGCIYPNGLLSTNEYFTFNHEDIKEVCVLGYSDQEDIEFKAELKSRIEG